MSGIPAASRKMVESLKEIVKDTSEVEIYSTLTDCNMDPNEAVTRLLSQDPFHEVKNTKRDYNNNNNTNTNNNHKKTPTHSTTTTTTTTTATRSRPSNIIHHHNTRPPSTTTTATTRAPRKPLPNKEHQNGTTTTTTPPFNLNTQLRSSDSVGVYDGLSSSSSSSHHAGLQSPWIANPGHVSMADIVKMGRPHHKPSASIQLRRASKVSETNHDRGFSVDLSVQQDDEWPSIEHQSPVVVDAVPNSEYYANSSNFREANGHGKIHVNEFVPEDGPVENPDDVVSAKSKLEDNPESASVFDGSFYKDDNSYQPHQHPFDNTEAEYGGVSSVDANFELLNLHTDDQGTEHEEDSPSVVIPDHLQLHTPECLNLSFGSFGSGNNAALSGSGPHASTPLKNNLEDTSEATDVSIIRSPDARNPYGDEHLTTSDGNLVQRTGVGAGTCEHSSLSQPEALKSEPPETAQENQYSFPSSSHDYTYENAQQAEVTFPHSQTSSQMQDLSPFSSVMAYTNSLPGAQLASTVQTAREDIPYSPFPVTQPMPAKYSNIASSIGGPAITMSEALRANSISTPQPNQQALPGANVATGPALLQHLAMHPYSQPTLPLGQYANMISYPYLPQSYTYMPSAFQQAFAGNSPYHQSLAAMLPQYKNSISVSSLPQTAAIPSGYGFGSSTSIPGGNFPLNLPAAPTSTTIGYDDVLNSQYKDNNHMISLQQNENSPMWVPGPGSRTMSTVPPSTYYSIQGQNQQQQPGGFRQSQQQPSQHFGPPGYPNFYHSQTGISLEHQQQNPREASLAGSQSQPSKQSQQIWQNSY